MKTETGDIKKTVDEIKNDTKIIEKNVVDNGEKIEEVINVHKVIKGKVFENGEKIEQVINMLDPNNTSEY